MTPVAESLGFDPADLTGRKIIGDLSDVDRVLVGLDLRPRRDAGGRAP
jgi:hypothetical protein